MNDSPISAADLTDGFSSAFGGANEGAAVSRLFGALIVEIAKGAPVPPAQLVAALDWPIERVTALLSKVPNIEYDDGKVVGAGLTLRETPHVFEIDDRRLYTWCALDALMFPALLDRTARVTSPCSATGAPVRLTVTPDGVRELEPRQAVVSLVVPDGSANIRGSFCVGVNFLVSEAAAAHWAAKPDGASIVSVEAAFRLGQELRQRMWPA